jgi:hypothetical protein
MTTQEPNDKPTEPGDTLIQVGVYIRRSHELAIEELKLTLRKRNIKTNTSAVVRTAIDFLLRQDTETLVDLFKRED